MTSGAGDGRRGTSHSAVSSRTSWPATAAPALRPVRPTAPDPTRLGRASSFGASGWPEFRRGRLAVVRRLPGFRRLAVVRYLAGCQCLTALEGGWPDLGWMRYRGPG